MNTVFFQQAWREMRRLSLISALILGAKSGYAESVHGIAMYGEPALPPDFVSLPYVNAAAPKTGRIVLGNTGGFDSLNPFVFKGTKPWQLPFLTHETLMGRSLDEPFTLTAFWPNRLKCRTAANGLNSSFETMHDSLMGPL